METPNTVVIVGGVDENQAKLQTQLKPTRVNENAGIAITSIYHGEVYNINKTNNTIHFAVEVVQIPDVQHGLIKNPVFLLNYMNLQSLKEIIQQQPQY